MEKIKEEIEFKKEAEPKKAAAKDYKYRSTWEHYYSRAYNKAKRGNMSKDVMMKTMGRFPKKDEWWLSGITEEEWIAEYIKKHPKDEHDK